MVWQIEYPQDDNSYAGIKIWESVRPRGWSYYLNAAMNLSNFPPSILKDDYYTDKWREANLHKTRHQAGTAT